MAYLSEYIDTRFVPSVIVMNILWDLVTVVVTFPYELRDARDFLPPFVIAYLRIEGKIVRSEIVGAA